MLTIFSLRSRSLFWRRANLMDAPLSPFPTRFLPTWFSKASLTLLRKSKNSRRKRQHWQVSLKNLSSLWQVRILRKCFHDCYFLHSSALAKNQSNQRSVSCWNTRYLPFSVKLTLFSVEGYADKVPEEVRKGNAEKKTQTEAEIVRLADAMAALATL